MMCLNTWKSKCFITLIVLLLAACSSNDNDSAGSANQPPTAAFTATPQTGSAPLQVQFDATLSTDADGHIDDYSWSFGDGGTGSGMITSHVYHQDGVYNATLTVTDNHTASNQSVTTITAGTSDNNPDSYPAATTVYLSRDFNTEDASDMWINGGGDVAEHNWASSYGYENSGAWQLVPTPTMNADNESNAGVSAGNGSDIPYDDTRVMVISYMIYMSQELADAISSGTGGFWNHGNKIIDVFNWNTVTQNEGDSSTRQVIKVRSDAGEVKFSHMAGGAGSEFYNDSRGQNLRFELNADQWIWISHVFDADTEVTRTYYKRQSDLSVIKALERYSIDGPENYAYTSAGWTLYQPGGGPARSIWGYWDDIIGIPYDPAMFVTLDRLRIANGWIDPPF